MRLLLFPTNLTMVWYAKVLLIKEECNVVLQSSKHEEITFPHEYLFVFTLYITGAILSKNVVNGGGFKKIYIKGRWPNGGGLSIEGGVQTFYTL